MIERQGVLFRWFLLLVLVWFRRLIFVRKHNLDDQRLREFLDGDDFG